MTARHSVDQTGPAAHPGSRPTDVASSGWLPPDRANVPVARHFVIRQLSDLGMAGRIDDAALIVTELVTNAILHAGTSFDVRLERLPHGARIHVTDRSPTLPVPRPITLTPAGGRGLTLLSALGRWGADPLPDGGKTVWCELDADPQPLDGHGRRGPVPTLTASPARWPRPAPPST